MESRRSSESRVVLVTGASRGLGRAIAVGFGAVGTRVVVNYRTNADEAGRTVKAVEDATAAVDRWHRLDVLVCNAAASDDSLLLRLSDEAWDRVLATTLTGAFLCLQSAGAVMQAQDDGSVILIGSFSALQGRAGQAPYAAAKAGLLGLLRSVAREWGPANVRVNMVLPGWHATSLTGFRADPAPAPFGPALGHSTAMDAVASFVVALADLRDVSGQVFNLDSRIPPF